MFDKKRQFLHPVNHKPYRAKDFVAKESGFMEDGTKLTRISARNPVVGNDYREGILVSSPNQKSMVVYGNHSDIEEIGSRIKSNDQKELPRLIKSLRFVGPSEHNSYILNKPAGERNRTVSEGEVENYTAAQKMYPSHDNNVDVPLTPELEEIRAAKAHVREIATEKFGGTHPTSSDGQKAIKDALQAADNAVNPPPQTSIVGGK